MGATRATWRAPPRRHCHRFAPPLDAVRVAVDTSYVVDLLRGNHGNALRLAACERVYLSLFVLAELRAGCLASRHGAGNEQLLRRFQMQPNVELLLPDSGTADHFAQLWLQLQKAGTPIPTHDVWIAALALQHQLVLLTGDAHFARIPQLVLA